MTSAPSTRARRAVSSPIPALPPISTTVWPRNSGSRCGTTGVGVLVMIPPSRVAGCLLNQLYARAVDLTGGLNCSFRRNRGRRLKRHRRRDVGWIGATSHPQDEGCGDEQGNQHDEEGVV